MMANHVALRPRTTNSDEVFIKKDCQKGEKQEIG
jgi:hypothetical protein